MKTPMLVIATLIFLSGIAVAKKVPPAVTHFLYLDVDTNKIVPFNSNKDMQIFILNPSGAIEPGMVYATSKDGTKVLVLPPEIAAGKSPLAPVTPQPESQN